MKLKDKLNNLIRISPDGSQVDEKGVQLWAMIFGCDFSIHRFVYKHLYTTIHRIKRIT